MFSPLEQFCIESLLPISVGLLDISITNSSICLFISCGLFLYFLNLVTTDGGKLVPKVIQSLMELIYEFLINLVQEQIGEKGKAFFPFIFALFTFLFSCNLIGMIPYSF